jgi:cytochrome c oxidase subunit 4
MQAHASHPVTHEEPHHAVPLSLYIKIYVILMVLLVLTVVVNELNFGVWNLPIALTIAAVKAILVIIYFMHLPPSFQA